jgi:ABC-2 type transport system ATP-binding protein
VEDVFDGCRSRATENSCVEGSVAYLAEKLIPGTIDSAVHVNLGPILLIVIVLGAIVFGFSRRSQNRHGREAEDARWEPTTSRSDQKGLSRPTSPDVEAPGESEVAAQTAVATSVAGKDGDGAQPDQQSTRARIRFGDGESWAVETHGLTKRFGDTAAVDDVELLVPRGSAFGYLGPNGAGKTTLIRTLLGLTKADRGTMSLLGYPVRHDRREALARVGAIVEEPGFHGHLSGRENLALLAAARGDGADQRIGPALSRVGLAERADHKVRSYSMGMRQRLGIAACLLGDPQLLILDEPMNGLDPAGMQQMRSMIRSFVDEGRTVMLSSHLLDEVERTCDAVAIVDHGRVIRQGPIDTLIRGAGSTEVRIVCSDPQAAYRVIAGSGLAASTSLVDSEVVVTLPQGAPKESVAEINRRLVQAGISVYGLREVRASLEDWFLSVTSRLGESE